MTTTAVVDPRNPTPRPQRGVFVPVDPEPASDYTTRMKILLNGTEREVEAPLSLAQLLETAGYGARRVLNKFEAVVVAKRCCGKDPR